MIFPFYCVLRVISYTPAMLRIRLEMISSCPVLLISAVSVIMAILPLVVRALKERIGIFKSIILLVISAKSPVRSSASIYRSTR